MHSCHPSPETRILFCLPAEHPDLQNAGMSSSIHLINRLPGFWIIDHFYSIDMENTRLRLIIISLWILPSIPRTWFFLNSASILIPGRSWRCANFFNSFILYIYLFIIYMNSSYILPPLSEAAISEPEFSVPWIPPIYPTLSVSITLSMHTLERHWFIH